MEYKVKSSPFDTSIVVGRHYEGICVKVVVKDKATGEIVQEDEFGNAFGKQTPRERVICNNGKYLFEISGVYAAIDLTMTLRGKENIP